MGAMSPVQSPNTESIEASILSAGLSRRRMGAGVLALMAGLGVAGTGGRLATAEGAAATGDATNAVVGGPVPGVGLGVSGLGGSVLGGTSRVRLLAFGDSITVGGVGWCRRDAVRSTSWLAHLGERCELSVAYAKSGATAQLLDAAPAPNHAGDLAIFAFGTNDRHLGRTVDEMLGDIGRYVSGNLSAFAGATIAVAGVGPRSGVEPAVLEAWNAQVSAAAAVRGWLFLDPWRGLRGLDAASWSDAALTRDGLHPTELGARLLGAGYESEIAWAVAGRMPLPE